MKEEFESIEELREELVREGNKDQLEALDAITGTRDTLFITGKAGSGKSTFLKRVLPFLGNSVVLAPTGVAALNVEGMTIHKFFRFNLEPYLPRLFFSERVDGGFTICNTFEGKATKIDCYDVVRCMDTLIIDEASMLRPDLLDRIADALRSIRGIAKKRGELKSPGGTKGPFGGVRLILIGDLSQLPPIVKKNDVLWEAYETRYFFSSWSIQMSGFRMFEFKKIYRQSDPKLIGMLNDIRVGKASNDTVSILNGLVGEPQENAIIMASTNDVVDEMNWRELSKLKGSECKFKAEITGTPPKEAPCEEYLTLKVGARVMITRNSVSGKYVNGSTGTVVKIPMSGDVIYVELDKGGKVPIFRVSWENVSYENVNNRVVSRVLGSITQFPLVLGWAITIHKSQGLTLDSIHVNLERVFESGQVYVALSRCRSLEGITLSSEFNPKTLKKDDVLEYFLENIRGFGGNVEPKPMQEVIKSAPRKFIDEMLNRQFNQESELKFGKLNGKSVKRKGRENVPVGL